MATLPGEGAFCSAAAWENAFPTAAPLGSSPELLPEFQRAENFVSIPCRESLSVPKVS